MPTQIDYADYRETDGVKTPFRWTLSRPNGRFTIQIDSMKNNAPVDDDRFAKPVANRINRQLSTGLSRRLSEHRVPRSDLRYVLTGRTHGYFDAKRISRIALGGRGCNIA